MNTVSSNWPTVPLATLVAQSRGISYGVVQPGQHQDCGVPIVRVSDIRANGIDDTRPLRIAPEIEQKHARTRLRGGEVLLSLVGTIGEVAIAPPELAGWNVARAVAVIPPGDEATARWLSLSLRMPDVQRFMHKWANDTVQKTLNLGDVARLPIPVPMEHGAEAIEELLGALDDKIALNRRMCRTLEDVVRTIFQNWFIDFGPSRAEAFGMQRIATDFDVSGLFPKTMDEDELGELPFGWKRGNLTNFANLNPESWSKSNYPSLIRYIDLTSVKWGRVSEFEELSSKQAPSRAQRVLRPGDTVFGTVRPGNGSYALIGEDGLTGSTGFAVLRPKSSFFREIVYIAVTMPERVGRIAEIADGGAYPAAQPKLFIDTVIPAFSDAVVEMFSSVTSPFLDRVLANQDEVRTLTALRDFLLPRLLSGEAHVRDAERQVKDMV